MEHILQKFETMIFDTVYVSYVFKIEQNKCVAI